MDERYILLARHGKSDAYGRIFGAKVERDIPLPHKDRPLTDNPGRKTGGIWETREVAADLRDECESPSGDDKVTIAEIWTGTHGCTKQTATIFAQALHLQKTESKDLNPEDFRTKQDPTELAANLRRSLADLKEGNAILVVGHEPQLDRLQDVLCGRSIPLRNSEVVCIKVSGQSKGRLMWVLSPAGDEKTLLELKQKIRSKMATAKLLGAVISALLGFSLAALIEKERLERLQQMETAGMMKLAVGFLFAGLGLYLLTMYAYDTLLMPVRLWTHSKPSKRPNWLVARPPSSATHILYLNMMHIWSVLFTPATWMVVLGLLCLAWAVFAPRPPLNLTFLDFESWGSVGCWISRHSELIVGGLLAALVGCLYRIGRPILGSRD